MKVLGINGSHRKGSTLLLLEEAMRELEGFDTEIISLCDYEIAYCKVCNACKKNGGICVVKDGYQKIAEKMKEADAIIVGSPVYFGSITGMLKSLFDRSRTLRVNWDLKDKVCAAIAVGATKHGGQEHTLQAIHAWALIHGMILVADSSPTAHFGGVAVAKQVDGKFEIDDWGIETARSVGRRVREVLNLIKR
ncbi:Multimeric flavodoxin WrbA [Desulfurobacterium pacificum]|uniref:Multimeric flavodoxin WrbA n=1 Tax=Desulfurobacterium pacificum TaxID=240166 RepID=A0ABY1NDJ8_9BACT|nr:flavodoxin family protein [Desulfurobacterium pacificum]SMP07131.1 Multimeric flavodoxin WrbA [Desulfurobacterium pacificum]